MKQNIHEEYMRKVFKLALKGSGKTSPNPMVGAILVKDGRIIAEGYHKGPGSPHAERMALDLAGAKSIGADLYVNLEPCFHYGRTPPCVDSVLGSGIKRIFISNYDPNPLVNGQSITKLRENGVEVFTGILQDQGFKLNEVFFKYITSKEPFVVLKSASSLDGKIATKTGESKWITGEKARNDGQSLRGKYDSILVGINTVIADDPMLTCRLKGFRNPYRIILDSSLRISKEAKILNLDDSPEKTIIFTTDLASGEKIKEIKKKARVISLVGKQIILKEVLRRLAEMEICSVLVEGGSKIHGSFISEGLVDKYYLYYAPMLIGGENAPGFFGGTGMAELSECRNLKIEDIRRIDKDLRLIIYPEKEEKSVYRNN